MWPADSSGHASSLLRVAVLAQHVETRVRCSGVTRGAALPLPGPVLWVLVTHALPLLCTAVPQPGMQPALWLQCLAAAHRLRMYLGCTGAHVDTHT